MPKLGAGVGRKILAGVRQGSSMADLLSVRVFAIPVNQLIAGAAAKAA
jgi:hypothetical protein